MKDVIRTCDTVEIRKGDQPGMICRDGSGYNERTISSMIDGGYTVFVEHRGKPRQRVTKKLLKEVCS